MCDGVLLTQGKAQLRKTVVLRRFKCFTFQALQLNANGVVIAIGSAAILRHASVPSPIVAADKLPNTSGAFNEKVR
jgi:hypothetical protein